MQSPRRPVRASLSFTLALSAAVGCADAPLAVQRTVGAPNIFASPSVIPASTSYTRSADLQVALPWDLAVNPVTNRIYVLSLDFTGFPAVDRLVVVDGVTQATIASVPIGRAQAIVVNPVTNRIYVADYSGRLKVVDGATNLVVADFPVLSGPRQLAVNPATNRVYVVGDAHTIEVIDGATNIVVAAIPLPGGYPAGLNINPLTNRLYTSSGASWLSSFWTIDAATNAILSSRSVAGGMESIAIDPATGTVYVCSFVDHTIIALNGVTGATIAVIPMEPGPRDLAFDPASGRLYAIEQGDWNVMTLAVVDVSTNAVLTRIPLEMTWAMHLALDETLQKIYVPDLYGNQVRVFGWTAPTGAELMINTLVSLVESGQLTDGEGTSLLSKIDAAATFAADGKLVPARNVLEAFIRQLEALVQAGRLSASAAQPLIEAAEQEIAGL